MPLGAQCALDTSKETVSKNINNEPTSLNWHEMEA